MWSKSFGIENKEQNCGTFRNENAANKLTEAEATSPTNFNEVNEN